MSKYFARLSVLFCLLRKGAAGVLTVARNAMTYILASQESRKKSFMSPSRIRCPFPLHVLLS